MKVASIQEPNKAFVVKDDKYQELTLKETLEKEVLKAVMVPLIISPTAGLTACIVGSGGMTSWVITSRLGEDGPKLASLQ